MGLKEEYLEKLETTSKELGGVSTLCVVDIEEGKTDVNESDIAKLRYIIITPRRVIEVERAIDFVTCKQALGAGLEFTPENGVEVASKIPKEVTKAMRKKPAAASFDYLFALTYALDKYDHWLNAEGDLDEAVESLGRGWNEVLAHSFPDLGIHSEYTYPGIKALLSILKQKIEAAPKINAKFNWAS
eukprot:Awhi_evm1s7054